ncbi:cytochrome c oxidase assembly protein [Pokkaliibacter sp. MBI-7]|uniref:cytochrome c oxidase assembly protein n=1 Tax=Pokkaliibacter sp. MBI-7 TaxID=3040600 RepID=UPI00244A61CE|nr:cytochrome c oxidase assembly protein [Pokkaliibacter sp. MBI-7]MDH2431561.1 cytochrome c oxidase assembly protein [Pokkaliibacter sp. MBI-7]
MDARTQRSLVWLVLLPVAMFGFGFALVPLYDVFCRVTGLNGKVNTSPLAMPVSAKVDLSRSINIQFVTQNNANMPWTFQPLSTEMEIHPGADSRAVFRVRNVTDHPMSAQAIPSISPAEAAQYFHKIQCFCFNQQHLAARESLDMPVIFYVDPELPDYIHTITLGYTLFDVTKLAARAN